MHELIEELVVELPDNKLISGRLASSIGLYGNHIVADGILAGGTMKDIADVFYDVLLKFSTVSVGRNDLHHWISDQMIVLTNKYITEINPTSPHIQDFLKQLQDKGIVLGIATADDYQTTEICLNHLGIKDYFDFILTADRFPNKKPHPSVVQAFCKQYSLEPEEVAVVGDTSVDMRLARNADVGLAIGVLSGASSRSQLEALADIIVPTAADILTEEKRFMWEVQPSS